MPALCHYPAVHIGAWVGGMPTGTDGQHDSGGGCRGRSKLKQVTYMCCARTTMHAFSALRFARIRREEAWC